MKVTNIHTFFDNIFCVNMDRRPDRWQQSLVEFKKIGIEDIVTRWTATENSNGVLGCALSHLTLIKKCKEDNLRNVLIFEDDVLFAETDMNRLNAALDDLNAIDSWDIFYVGVTMCPTRGNFLRITDRVLKTNFAYTTHAYAVNAQAFDPIIEAWTRNIEGGNMRPCDVVLDESIVRARSQSFVMDPIYAIQQPGVSDIENNEIETYEWMITDFNRVKAKGV
jgi:GR25 family glycosyltransferase involved in LPS biosynthesis